MLLKRSRARVHGYYQRRTANLLFRRPFVINTPRPIVSFTFDDFPQSALSMGGAILNGFGLAGTYYACLGFVGREMQTGRIFGFDDLQALFDQGHELGCHTFSHCHSWDTPTRLFERSIIENRAALNRALPGFEFKTFSYPISPPRPCTKSRMGKYFLCCRGGGQMLNAGVTDLNNVSAFFLEKSRDSLKPVKELIDRNRQARGWLVFATHDICDNPTPFGCTPQFFEDVVKYSVSSGASILPVAGALKRLRSGCAGYASSGR